jgi:DNA-binding HxlR family transcriptional regulator
MANELKSSWNEAVMEFAWGNLRKPLPKTCLANDELEVSTESLSLDNLCSRHDLNQVPSKHKYKLVPLHETPQ